MSEWGGMSIRKQLFQRASTIKIQRSVLVYYKANLIIILLKINLFSSWYSRKIAELALNNKHWHSLLKIKLIFLPLPLYKVNFSTTSCPKWTWLSNFLLLNLCIMHQYMNNVLTTVLIFPIIYSPLLTDVVFDNIKLHLCNNVSWLCKYLMYLDPPFVMQGFQ